MLIFSMIDQYSHESRTTNALHTPSASQQAACLRTLGPLALAVRALHCSDAACTQAMRQPARTGAVSTTAQLRLTLVVAVPAVLQRQWTPPGKSRVNFGCQWRERQPSPVATLLSHKTHTPD